MFCVSVILNGASLMRGMFFASGWSAKSLAVVEMMFALATMFATY